MSRESKKDHKDHAFKGICHRRRPKLSTAGKLAGLSFLESYNLMLDGDSIVKEYATVAG